MSFERYKLSETALLKKPADIPSDYIAYNPSAIWTTVDKSGTPHDIMYVRVEPDRANSQESHLGKTVSRPYIVDVCDFDKPLEPYDDAEEKRGEDPALTRINRRLGSGAIEKIWLLSCVDARPYPFKPNEVRDLHTRFYAGPDLGSLEHVADGPAWMKDIRIAPRGDDSTELHIYGRPRLSEFNGNITHTVIPSLDYLNSEAIVNATYLDERIFPAKNGIWGGVNDAIKVGPDRYILACHRAWKVGENMLHYESVLLGHDTQRKVVTDLGVLATAGDFPRGKVKSSDGIDLHDVVFTGGGYNGGLDYMTFGVGDGSIGIGKF